MPKTPATKADQKKTPIKIRHRKVLAYMVEKDGNAGKALKAAGYSKAIQKNPKKVLETKSFLALCDENGLSEDRLTAFLNEDIEAKAGNRKGELELAFRIRGRLNPDIVVNNNKNLGIVYLPSHNITKPSIGEGLD